VLGDFRVDHHPNGQHAWLELPEPWRAAIFIAEARLDKVAVTPAEPFVAGPAAAPHGIRISVGAARSVDELRAGLLVLRDMLRRDPEPFYLPT
jgi:DNA-binding transcriptional MocR family regulator